MWTIHSTTCGDVSLIDYVICTPDLLPNVTNFKVDKFDPLMSDKHNPICVNFMLNKSLHTNHTNPVKEKTIPNTTKNKQGKSKWDNSKKDDYQNSFDLNKIGNMLLNLSTVNASEVTLVTIDKIALELNDIFIDPAKTTGMHKQVPVTNKPRKPKVNKPWFNTQCKNSKENYKKFKKSLPNQPNDTNKADLRSLARQHNKLLRMEKRKFDKEFNAKLKSLKSSNPGEYWKIINQGKRSSKIGDIPPNILYDHFHNLNKAKSKVNTNTPEILIQNNNEIINPLWCISTISVDIL